MDVSAGFSLIPRSNLKIGGNELDEKAIESKNKTDVDCDDKGASVKRTEAECVSRSEKSCATDIYSECGSSSAPLEGNDPMKLWKAMKQNGFLSNPHVGGVSVTSSSCVVSSSHGGIPTCYVGRQLCLDAERIRSPRCCREQNEMMMIKMEDEFPLALFC